MALLAAIGLAAATGSAEAADVFRYDVTISPVSDSTATRGRVTINGIDQTKTTRVRWMQGASEISHADFPTGTATPEVTFAALAAGDAVQVQQPIGTTLESFPIPPQGIVAAAGSTSATGTAPVGWQSLLLTPGTCNSGDGYESVPVAGGGFGVALSRAPLAGDQFELYSYSGKGDRVRYLTRLGGESPCIDVDAHARPPLLGSSPDPAPFGVRVSYLRAAVASDARVTIVRGGTPIFDQTAALSSGSVSWDLAAKPQSGDVVSIYRPSGAAAPASTFAIPQLSAIYDAGVGLAAIDGPAGNFATVWVDTGYLMQANVREAYHQAAGRTLFDFSHSQGGSPAISLGEVTNREARWGSADGLASFSFDLAPGDLTAPRLKLRLSSKVKLSAVRSKFSFKVSSTESTRVKARLEFPAARKGKKPLAVATASATIGTKPKNVSAKLTSKGRAALRKLRAKGKRFKSQKATLTLIATDAAGNASTTVKSLKLVRK